MKEPELIKAGDTRLKLGHPGQPPLVDVRVIVEENYQELLNQANKNLVKAHVSHSFSAADMCAFAEWYHDCPVISMLEEDWSKGFKGTEKLLRDWEKGQKNYEL